MYICKKCGVGTVPTELYYYTSNGERVCGECFNTYVNIKPKQGGKKFDEGKRRWDLLPYNAVEDIVAVLTFGAHKYEDNNWQHVTPFKSRYLAATMRHIVAWIKGEKIDPESGINHLAHAACCILFLIWGDKKVESEATQT